MATAATQTDDELEIPEELEGQAPQVEEGAPEEEKTPEQIRIASLEAERDAAIAKASKGQGSIEDLLEMGKQFLANQKATPAPTPDNSAQLEAWGKKAQELAISGDPKEFAQFLATAVDQIAQTRITQTTAQLGGIAERAGEFAVRVFLEHKGDELGPNAEKTHRFVSRNFKLSPEESSWVATANSTDSQAFLERKYRETAGEAFLKSSRSARPRNIDAGASGGGKGASNGLTFAGVDQREMEKQIKLAEEFWPDPAVREKKLKAIADRMAAERNS